MDLPEDTQNHLHKNTIQYLHNIADKVPNTLNILKSYYASKFQISQLQTKIILEKNKNKLDARCPKCCLKLRETDASYIVKPAKRSKFAQKLANKVESKKSLTKFQEKYLKQNDVKEGNKLVITCNFCKKEIVHKLTKPARPKVNDVIFIPIVGKKKKKKDKFAGLHKETVQSVQGEIIGGRISKKQERIKKKKVLMKLTNLLSQKDKSENQPKNNLALFLEGVSATGAQNSVEEIIDLDKSEPEILNTSISKKKIKSKNQKNNQNSVFLPQNLVEFTSKKEVIDLDKSEEIPNNAVSKKKKKSKIQKIGQSTVFFVDKVGRPQNLAKFTKGSEVTRENFNNKNKTLNNAISKNKKKSKNNLNFGSNSNGRKSNLFSFLQSFNK